LSKEPGLSGGEIRDCAARLAWMSWNLLKADPHNLGELFENEGIPRVMVVECRIVHALRRS
jgi:hypothetical protein